MSDQRILLTTALENREAFARRQGFEDGKQAAVRYLLSFVLAAIRDEKVGDAESLVRHARLIMRAPDDLPLPPTGDEMERAWDLLVHRVDLAESVPEGEA